MGDFSRLEAAERAGVGLDDLHPLVALGILSPDDDDRFSIGDVRRIGLVHSFVAAGMPLEGLVAHLRDGAISLAWLDSPAYDRFSSYSGVTFQELSERTGVPVDLLMVIREAIGGALPAPSDRMARACAVRPRWSRPGSAPKCWGRGSRAEPARRSPRSRSSSQSG